VKRPTLPARLASEVTRGSPVVQPVFINRISAFLPHEPVDNEQMEARLGLVGGKPSRARKLILRSNGIQQRHYVIDPQTGEPSMSNAQVSAAAIRGLFGGDFQLENLDCLVASSASPDQVMPGHAVMVQGELGNPPCEVVTTAGICLCGMTALKYAWMSVASGESRNAVACVSTPSTKAASMSWKPTRKSPSRRIFCAGCSPMARVPYCCRASRTLRD